MVVTATLALIFVVAVLVWLLVTAMCGHSGKQEGNKPPGPKPWPFVGSLHLLGHRESPFQALNDLAKVYGDVYSITLGTTPCVVVNSFQLIKEVLITKGSHFGDRPNFIRFHKLFGGDRNNSLALCDWSDLQKTRRSIARVYCSPRFASVHYDNLDQVGCAEVNMFLAELSRVTKESKEYKVKTLMQAACFNMFTQYMCSTRFEYDNAAFVKVVRTFDDIFWEMNQGYAIDFIPWLLPVYKGHMDRISTWSHSVRQFIMSHIVETHRRSMDCSAEPRDFTDALLMYLEEDKNLSWEHIIFELEDFLGGHSAVGGLTMLIMAEVVRHPEVGKRIQTEVDAATGGQRNVNLFDKPLMPYTEATILEVLRTASSPIVPHAASQDTTIAGYHVERGTVVFINNYNLNTSEKFWEAATEFRPERFISDGKVSRPQYFIPFSTGKRTCIGQRLVQGFSFLLAASILQHFDVTSSDLSLVRTYPACVAVPSDTFPLTFTPRNVSFVHST